MGIGEFVLDHTDARKIKTQDAGPVFGKRLRNSACEKMSLPQIEQ
jgi:hypothetical protein